jgi:hypothetical protein
LNWASNARDGFFYLYPGLAASPRDLRGTYLSEWASFMPTFDAANWTGDAEMRLSVEIG